jgi:hypothetical protein
VKSLAREVFSLLLHRPASLGSFFMKVDLSKYSTGNFDRGAGSLKEGVV